MNLSTKTRAGIAVVALGGVPVWVARVACTVLDMDLPRMHWVTVITAGLVAGVYCLSCPRSATRWRALLLPLGVWVVAPLGASVSLALHGGEPWGPLAGLILTLAFPVSAQSFSAYDGSLGVLLIAPVVMGGVLGAHALSRALLSKSAAKRGTMIASALLGRAQAAYQSRDCSGALRLLEEAIEALPTSSPAWLQRAWILATSEDPGLRDARRAWHHGAHDGTRFVPSPSFPLPVLGMHSEKHCLEGLEVAAAVLARQGDCDRAIRCQRTAIDIARRSGIAGAELMLMGRRLAAYQRGDAWTESDPRAAPLGGRDETERATRIRE